MGDDPERPVVLVSLPTESEGAMVVAWLGERDILAMLEGGFTAGFRAEAPGFVKVLVRERDLDQARQALQEYEAGGRPPDEG